MMHRGIVLTYKFIRGLLSSGILSVYVISLQAIDLPEKKKNDLYLKTFFKTTTEGSGK
jgi:hypothetical protein